MTRAGGPAADSRTEISEYSGRWFEFAHGCAAQANDLVHRGEVRTRRGLDHIGGDTATGDLAAFGPGRDDHRAERVGTARDRLDLEVGHLGLDLARLGNRCDSGVDHAVATPRLLTLAAVGIGQHHPGEGLADGATAQVELDDREAVDGTSTELLGDDR